MELYFCDLCNESVPQGDLELGRAWRRGNRVVCNACEQSMSEGGRGPIPQRASLGGTASAGTAMAVAEREQAAPALAPGPTASVGAQHSTHSSGASGAWMLGGVALIFTGVAAYWTLQRTAAVDEELAAADRSVRSEQSALAAELAALRNSVEARMSTAEQRGAQERSAQFAGLSATLSKLRDDCTRLERVIGGLAEKDASLAEDQRQALEAMGGRIEALGATFGDLEGGVAFHSDRLIELEERVHALAQGGAWRSEGVGAAPDEGVPTWQPFLADLASAQAAARLDALYALEKSKDMAVVPYVVPMLQDVDIFVRMAAARVLEDLRAKNSVPALIDALEDTEPVVTESAMFALQKITGQDFGFEPNAPVVERAKKIKAWRDWWKKEGEAFLAGGTAE